MSKHKNLFSERLETVITMHLTTDQEEETRPIHQQPYCAEQRPLEELCEYINKHLEAAQVIPAQSASASSTALVSKMSLSLSFCVHFRRFKDTIIPFPFLLLRMNAELTSQLKTLQH